MAANTVFVFESKVSKTDTSDSADQKSIFSVEIRSVIENNSRPPRCVYLIL